MRLHPQARILLIAVPAICAGFVCVWPPSKRALAPAPQMEISPAAIWADGHDAATVTIASASPSAPRVSVLGNAHITTAGAVERNGGAWTAEIHAGVLPGNVRIRVEVPGAAPAFAELTANLAGRDSLDDGMPDFMRLDSEAQRNAFRRWFTFLAEAQFFQPSAARPAEISDCAALIRYSYREALRAHDGAWAAASRLPMVPAFDSPSKYEYPYTALGAALFRVTPGPFRAADTANGAFAQFADAKTLWRLNTHLVSRDLRHALPGDILFYRQRHGDDAEPTFHSMIFLGPSQIHPDGARYVLYHTGPDDSGPGEMRRLTLDQLQRFPEPEWRPGPENPNFLGVYRWNILAAPDSHS